jgi:hypothetical protein
MKDLLKDKRQIKKLAIQTDAWQLGTSGVTEILVTTENGQMSPVPWFVVMQGDMVATRVNGAFVVFVDYV